MLIVLTGCSHHRQGMGEWRVGEAITVEGIPGNAKMGALLQLDNGEVLWIDGMDEWPGNCFTPEGKGKRLRVTGTLISRDDLPAYVAKPGELPKTGMPVQSEDQLKAARQRFLLKDTRWAVL